MKLLIIFQLRERPLIEKFYETGQKFLTMFPDGTGNVLYPSLMCNTNDKTKTFYNDNNHTQKINIRSELLVVIIVFTYLNKSV